MMAAAATLPAPEAVVAPAPARSKNAGRSGPVQRRHCTRFRSHAHTLTRPPARPRRFPESGLKPEQMRGMLGRGCISPAELPTEIAVLVLESGAPYTARSCGAVSAMPARSSTRFMWRRGIWRRAVRGRAIWHSAQRPQPFLCAAAHCVDRRLLRLLRVWERRQTLLPPWRPPPSSKGGG